MVIENKLQVSICFVLVLTQKNKLKKEGGKGGGMGFVGPEDAWVLFNWARGYLQCVMCFKGHMGFNGTNGFVCFM